MRSRSTTDRLTAVLLGVPAQAGAGAHAPALRSFPRRLRKLVAPDTGASGERLVARVRLGLALLLVVPALVPRPDAVAHRVALLFVLATLSLAGLLYWLAGRAHRPWLGYLSSGLDVTLVSAASLTAARLGLGGGRDWPALYTLAIAFAGLRDEWRLAVLTGLFAMGQHAWLASLVGEPGEAWVSHQLVLAAGTVISAAIVLHSSRLRRLANTDRLTGLANRGAFDERLRAEWGRARRYGRPLSLALLDVDHFKRFNDVHGHATGDAALRMVANELRDSFRTSDLVARYGGEEFAILLPETPADAAFEKIQEACSRLAATRMLIGRTKTGRLTVSAGVAAWPADDHDLDRWVARADERLYAAKAGGRNRVVGRPEGGTASRTAGTTEGDDDDGHTS